MLKHSSQVCKVQRGTLYTKGPCSTGQLGLIRYCVCSHKLGLAGMIHLVRYLGLADTQATTIRHLKTKLVDTTIRHPKTKQALSHTNQTHRDQADTGELFIRASRHIETKQTHRDQAAIRASVYYFMHYGFYALRYPLYYALWYAC